MSVLLALNSIATSHHYTKDSGHNSVSQYKGLTSPNPNLNP